MKKTDLSYPYKNSLEEINERAKNNGILRCEMCHRIKEIKCKECK